MSKREKDELKEVYAGTSIQAAMIVSLLEEAHIKTFLKDEVMGSLNPWHSAAGGFGAVKVLVSSTDSDMAEEIIAAFNE